MSKKKVYEGVYRGRIRYSLKKYKKNKDLLELCRNMVSLGDCIDYAWKYYYIMEHLRLLFKEILPKEYILGELTK